jgi:BirA family biotin operon repressor/biotin-[acetyl-CoA-carboxylase] ligase
MSDASPTDTLPLVDAVRSHLQTEHFGRRMRGYESVDSTNTHAAHWAAEGAPEGSVVVTEYQTAGRGRHGRTWTADAGKNLMFSVVLRPDLPPDRLGLITLCGGVAVAETVEGSAPLRATIKWPNDVLLRGRKCCGMLLESSLSGQRDGPPEFVILGIGLNVNQDRFPPEIADQATSIQQAAHRPIERAPLFAELLLHLERRYQSLFEDDGASVRDAYEERLHDKGRPITLRFTGSEQTIRGTVRGITSDGALRLGTPTGIETVRAGEVTSR